MKARTSVLARLFGLLAAGVLFALAAGGAEAQKAALTQDTSDRAANIFGLVSGPIPVYPSGGSAAPYTVPAGNVLVLEMIQVLANLDTSSGYIAVAVLTGPGSPVPQYDLYALPSATSANKNMYATTQSVKLRYPPGTVITVSVFAQAAQLTDNVGIRLFGYLSPQ